MNCASSSGLLDTASNPRTASACLKSGSATTWAMSALSFLTMGAGVPWDKHGEPEADVYTRQSGFRKGRHVRQPVHALACGDRKPAQCAALDVRDRGRCSDQEHRDVAGE